VSRCSSLYSTEPVGFAGQPRFVNAVVELETELAARELLDALLNIELEFGRDRASSFVNGPRTLDLDILLIPNEIVDEAGLEIPHPRLAERAFVLVPLCEIDGLIFDARQGKTVSQLLHELLPGLESERHAVVRIEFGGWGSGPCIGGMCGGAA
jgi:2-amino-4-hydroxy-6-hydroxymethyldihydropteridine diphosphokinase